jgi:hypothetical protein
MPTVTNQFAAGVAGASARREYERRHQKRQAAIEARWGRLAGVVNFLTDDPQSTRALARGAVGEERLARDLGQRLNDSALVLHDRKVPGTRGNIDHLVISPGGVWIVDAKNYTGLVERRDVGGWFKTDLRLFVGGRDRTKAVDGLGWQLTAVGKALGDDTIPVHPMLCFISAEWRLFSKPFEIRGVWCVWAKKLAEMINAPGPIGDDRIVAITQLLTERLPANRST